MSSPVLDASALLAYLHNESGADLVEQVLSDGACISTANLAEVLSKLADIGQDPAKIYRRLQDQGLLGGALQVMPLTTEDAELIAELRPVTKPFGLSLGDRACLALGLRLDALVLTADRIWSKLELRMPIRMIR